MVREQLHGEPLGQASKFFQATTGAGDTSREACLRKVTGAASTHLPAWGGRPARKLHVSQRW